MRFLFLSIFLVAASTLQAQKAPKAQTFECILHLPKGASQLVDITRTKTRTARGKQPTSNSFHYAARVTMVDSSREERVFKWVYEAADNEEDNPAAAAAMQILNGLEIYYKTDDYGMFTELVEWEKVRDFYLNLMSEALPPSKGDTTDEVLQKTKALFSSREMVEATLIREIMLFHSLHGRQYSTKKESEKTSISTPLTETPVPAWATTQVTSVAKDSYSVMTKQTINQKEALNMFKEIFLKMGVGNVIADKEARNALTSFQLIDEGQYKVSKASGLLLSATFSRTAQTSAIKQVDTYHLTIH